MNLPKYHETFIPILRVLSDGKVIHYNTLRQEVRDTYYSSLSEDLLNIKTKSGDLLILNRIGWGIAYLKRAKLIEQPERAQVKITEKGQKVLKEGTFTFADLIKDNDFKSYQDTRKGEKGTNSLEHLHQSESPEDMLEAGFLAIEKKVKNDLLEKLLSKDLNHYYFEKIVLILLKKMGYGDFIETSKSRDGGIDGIINQDQLGLEKIYMQAKHYKQENIIHEKHIRDFIGAMSDDTNKGIFVTTSSFDSGAIAKAKAARHTIILIDGNKLIDLMNTYGIGVQVRNTYEVKEIDEDFFEET